MAITYVASGTAFNRITSGTGWTWNKPGVSAGDLMIGSVVFDAGGSQRTYTLPSGWTLVKEVYKANGDGITVQMVVAYRFAESGDGSSWAGTIGVSTATAAAAVSAYRGVQGIGSSNSGSASITTSCSTGSATSPSSSGAWRLVVGAYSSGSASYTISSNETARRITYTADDSGDTGALQGSIWDSDNAVTASTSYSKTVSRSANWSAAVATIFYLTNQTGTPATGTLAGTLNNVDALADGEVHDDATVSASLAPVVGVFEGYGQPPVVTGTFAAALAPASASMTGGTVVSGSVSALVSVRADIVGETRAFGVRVLNVEAESRVIRVESRGVAD